MLVDIFETLILAVDEKFYFQKSFFLLKKTR